jgi:hypothetical protein
MVSNSLELGLQELLDTVERLRREHGSDPNYQELRKELPDEWPL